MEEDMCVPDVPMQSNPIANMIGLLKEHVAELRVCVEDLSKGIEPALRPGTPSNVTSSRGSDAVVPSEGGSDLANTMRVLNAQILSINRMVNDPRKRVEL